MMCQFLLGTVQRISQCKKLKSQKVSIPLRYGTTGFLMEIFKQEGFDGVNSS